MKFALTIALMTVVSMAELALGWPGNFLDGKNALSRMARDSPPELPMPDGCTVDGRYYENGASFNMGFCTKCRCRNGVHSCMATLCQAPPCVDYVQDEEHCCGFCPNGPNCRGPKGQLIRIGEAYPMADGDLECTCALVGDKRAGIRCNFEAQEAAVDELNDE